MWGDLQPSVEAFRKVDFESASLSRATAWKPADCAVQEQQKQQFQNTAGALGSALDSSKSLTIFVSPCIIATCSARLE